MKNKPVNISFSTQILKSETQLMGEDLIFVDMLIEWKWVIDIAPKDLSQGWFLKVQM